MSRRHPIAFGGAMHPGKAIRFAGHRPRLRAGARERRFVSQALDAALAVALGLALAYVLFHGWSGGFRP